MKNKTLIPRQFPIRTLHRGIILLLLLTYAALSFTQTKLHGTITDSGTQQYIYGVSILDENSQQYVETDRQGQYELLELKQGKHQLIFFAEGYTTTTKEIDVTGSTMQYDLAMDSLGITLEAIEVEAETRQVFGLRRLRNVEGMGIYGAKKSEVIDLTDAIANLATNNPRQVYKGIAGLNIWENDGAGLQLSIGARGLDPNRTSNFNTRQNGYDISADALGYPESYYTPPTQALSRIEIVRGAASLQYGTQFGGLLNFIFRKGSKNKAFEFTSENTIGSFGLFNSFTSIGGTKSKLNYYAFYQRKQGDGWRINSDFEQNTAFANINFQLTPKLKLTAEYTHMDYLAQQAGGLVDFEFEQNPRQSKRERNWFKVNWELMNLSLDYRISDQTKINIRNFYLNAQRQALGALNPINRPDPLRERDLINGEYNNFGSETRLIHRYTIKDNYATFLVGARLYWGQTFNQQGLGTAASDADFRFLNPNNLESSEYKFPSRNVAFFAENLLNLSKRWSITPGIRWEYIRTASDGFFKRRVFSGGQVIFEETIQDAKENSRSFVLLGLGSAYKIKEELEAYINFSQNFRSINFSDLAVVNPNLIVDSLLSDENGFNADIGLRGSTNNNTITFDVSLFYLQYKDRIGITEIIIPDPAVIERAVNYRTNIGDARVIGLEAYGEIDLLGIFRKREHKKMGLTAFANVSLLKGKYLTGGNDVLGNDVELIPPFSIKTGINFRFQNFHAAYQYAYIQEHYSDATNAVVVANATRGLIPSYQVMDLSMSYQWRWLKVQTGINNLSNATYFTRRATGYPGPGIIPSEGRSFYLTLGVRF